MTLTDISTKAFDFAAMAQTMAFDQAADIAAAVEPRYADVPVVKDLPKASEAIAFGRGIATKVLGFQRDLTNTVASTVDAKLGLVSSTEA